MEIRLVIFIFLSVAALASKLFFRRAYAWLKPLPLIFIIALAFIKPAHPDVLWLAAISFGLLGDLFLLRPSGFVPGLLCFLLGHLAYFVALGVTPPASALVGVGALAVGVYLYLARHLIAGRQKKYLLPVLAYIIVSATLVSTALFFQLRSFAVIGAVSFAFSDFLLAYNKFVRQNPYVDAGVSITYFAAQWLLALHFVAI